VYPVLFKAFGQPVHAYVVATVLGYGVAIVIGLILGRRDGRDWRDLLDGALVITLSAVLGAKIFHTLFEAAGHHLPDGTVATGLIDLLRADPWHWARLFEAGYVFYGGVVGGILMGFLFVVRREVTDPLAAGDYAAPGFALGIAIGRTGCLLAGCCYGHETGLPWAISFPSSHPTHGALVHPVQLYDVGFGLVAFALTLVLYKRRRFGGDLFAGLMVAYAAWRFFSELFRGDGDRGVWALGLSTSQFVSLALLPTTVAVWIWMAKHRPRYADLRPPETTGDGAPPSTGVPA
jgi:phosphatidylglycerol:prolipoprotein diacylglycerol transferase